MPEIIVRAEAGAEREGPVLLKERVTEGALESGHYAEQLIERIGWAVIDASDVQRRAEPERRDAGA